MIHLIGHWLGLDNASGAPYLWWSGVGADLGMVGTAYALVRRLNCEIHGCPRLGRHVTAVGHRLCRRHHPDGPLTVEQAHAAHREAGS